MGSAEVLAAPTEKVQFMEDMKTEVRRQHNSSNSWQERQLLSANMAAKNPFMPMVCCRCCRCCCCRRLRPAGRGVEGAFPKCCLLTCQTLRFVLAFRQLFLLATRRGGYTTSTDVALARSTVTFSQDLAKSGAVLPAGLVNLGNTCYMNSTLQCLRKVSYTSSAVLYRRRRRYLRLWCRLATSFHARAGLTAFVLRKSNA